MQSITHRLAGTVGTVRELVSLHFGSRPAGSQKIYIQASLHADEVPAMLVAHHLRARLQQLEREARLQGEVVLVPVANPIGLSQHLLHAHLGRFDLTSGHNFNRHYPSLGEAVATQIDGKLTHDSAENVALIRDALRMAVSGVGAETELAQQKKTLFSLACDADVVLDLHCDCEAVVHLYTGTDTWPAVEPLARYLGSEASLLSSLSGDDPFDEACSRPWWDLAARFPAYPIPPACVAVTIELRGELDVTHALAERDADAIINYLRHRGVVKGSAPPLPPLKAPATPLEGSMPVVSRRAGVVTFLRAPGDYVRVGDTIAEVIDPLTADVTSLTSDTDGILYARENRRYVTAGMRIAKVAGHVARRTGKLLSA
jgi:hypothetical protein